MCLKSKDSRNLRILFNETRQETLISVSALLSFRTDSNRVNMVFQVTSLSKICFPTESAKFSINRKA